MLKTKRFTALLVIAVLVLGGVAAVAWYQSDRADRRESASRGALAAATAATQAIFSYDYRQFDASVANGKQFVTGQFAKEYQQTTVNLKPTAVKEQAVVRAQVSAASVVSASASRVDVLVYVNQYRKNANITGEKVDQNRVVLAMTRDGREWRVMKATAI
jgi:Mce-associated membrane protein